MATLSINETLDYVQTQTDSIISYLQSYYSSWTTANYDALDFPVDTPYGTTVPAAIFEKLDKTIDDIHDSLDPFVANIQNVNADILSTLPNKVDVSDYTQYTWDEAWWTTLKNKVQVFLDTTTSLTETNAMQDAMYEKDLARRQYTLRDLYSAADVNTSAKGFLFPNSITTALKLDAQQKFQFDAATASRDIYKYVIEWAKANFHKSLDTNIQAHNSDIDFTTRYMGVVVDTYVKTMSAEFDRVKNQILLYTSQYEASIKEYEALLSFEKSRNDNDVNKLKAWVEHFVANIKNQSEFLQMSINAELQRAQVKTAAATASLNGLGALTKGIADIKVAIT